MSFSLYLYAKTCEKKKKLTACMDPVNGMNLCWAGT